MSFSVLRIQLSNRDYRLAKMGAFPAPEALTPTLHPYISNSDMGALVQLRPLCDVGVLLNTQLLNEYICDMGPCLAMLLPTAHYYPFLSIAPVFRRYLTGASMLPFDGTPP